MTHQACRARPVCAGNRRLLRSKTDHKVMKSSFVRKGTAGSAAGLGTRPGVHGETLISTGLADFDSLLGGGVPIGALVLILEDAWTPHGSTLLRYFLAEGAVCGHTVHWAAATRPVPSALPQVAKPRSRSSRKDGDKEAEEQESPQLRIAWQYRRYIQRQQLQQQSGLSSLHEDLATPGMPTLQGANLGRLTSPPTKGAPISGGPRDWCHQYDLTKPMEESTIKSARLDRQQYRGPVALNRLIGNIQELVDGLQPSGPASSVSSPSLRPTPQKGPGNIGRVAVEGLGAAAWHLGMPAPEQARHLLLAVTRISNIVRRAQCSAMITIPAGELEASAVTRLEQLGDTVIALEAVRSDSGVARMISDSSSCCGLLRVQKCPQSSADVKALPQTDVHVLRHKRRRLAFEVLQVDPDAEAVEAERSNKRSGAAGLLCSGPPAAGASPLDF